MQLDGNYAGTKANNVKVTLNQMSYFYSYKTLIAVMKGEKLAIRSNEWGPTTGEHLNCIDRDKSKRVDLEEFQRIVTSWEKK